MGSVNGSDEHYNDFLKEKPVNYSSMLEKLAKHSKVSPQFEISMHCRRIQ